jgi:hypothetical protein
VAQQLILKRASASRPSGEWNDDDYDVFAEGVVVGRISEAMRYLANVRRPMSYAAASSQHDAVRTARTSRYFSRMCHASTVPWHSR